MPVFERLALPKLETPQAVLEIPQGAVGLCPAAILAAEVRTNPRICAEAAIEQHIEKVRAGETPGFTIESGLMDLMLGGILLARSLDVLRYSDQTEERTVLSGESLGFRQGVAKACFEIVNRLFGQTPEGRKLHHFEGVAIRHPDQSRQQEGAVHIDSFDGLTVHVQRTVGGRRFREVKMGLYRSEEPVTDRQQFDSVEEGVTEPQIWEGTVCHGDVTVLNSGLWLPDGSYGASVHQFKMAVHEPNRGGKTVSFSQFIN